MTAAAGSKVGAGSGGELRRDLGTLQSYAGLVGILVGAGIFRVTSDAWRLTGPSVILGHAVLVVPVLATSVGYAVFLSTPLGERSGGDYTHLRETFGRPGLAYLGGWLKIVSYIGALAFLAGALADYLVPLLGGLFDAAGHRTALALGGLAFFCGVHAWGVRWFGRLQVGMCVVLGVSIGVLVLPGLFAVERAHYQPFFTAGAGGFMQSLVPLFFAYAGFEALAHTGGEVAQSRRRLPRVFLGGILATAVIFVSMSLVTFGVVPGAALAQSNAPMADVAAAYLPRAGSLIVALGAVMALATSLNATMLVPSRVALTLARDGLLPAWMGKVDRRTGAPVVGLALTLLGSAALLLSGQVALALNIAVFALFLLYFGHSLALLLLPRCNPVLDAQVTVGLSPGLRATAAWVSMLSMGALIVVQVRADLAVLAGSTLTERLSGASLTSLELLAAWVLVGMLLRAASSRSRRPAPRGAS